MNDSALITVEVKKNEGSLGEYFCANALELVHLLSEVLLLHSAKVFCFSESETFSSPWLEEVKETLYEHCRLTGHMPAIEGPGVSKAVAEAPNIPKTQNSFENRFENLLENILSSTIATLDEAVFHKSNAVDASNIASETGQQRSLDLFENLSLTRELFSRMMAESRQRPLLYLVCDLALEKRKYYLSLVDKIEGVRARNNVNWMELMRLAFKTDPYEAKKILKNIHKDDSEISSLLAKLSGVTH